MSASASSTVTHTRHSILHHPCIENSTTLPDDCIIMASATLLEVPPELQLRILSSLPAKQIQRCRRINRHFQQLIDAKQNQSLCFGPGISISRQTLREVVATLCDYPVDTKRADGTPCAFIDMISNWMQVQRRFTYTQSVLLLSRHWLRKSPPPGPRNPNAERAEVDFEKHCMNVVICAEIFVALEVFALVNHLGIAAGTRLEPFDALTELMMLSGYAVGWSSAEHVEKVRKAVIEDVIHCIDQRAKIKRTERPSARLAVLGDQKPADMNMCKAYGEKNARLSVDLNKLLGTPVLEDTAPVT